ncbi:MAG: hypothetical protein LBO69_05395 [Ignavibacteria bacterium]|jgi:tetratricopeptide (TPR) repeat protein|nr:hypothetical protein [Ignavibacteria bacterium]
MKKLIIPISITIAIIASGCSSQEDKANALCDIGWKFIIQGKEKEDTTLFDSANSYFEKALAIAPTPLAYSGKAYYYERKDNLDEAMRYTDKALSIDSNCHRAFFVKGIIAIKQKDYQLSIKYHQKQYKNSIHDTDKANALRNLALLYYRLGKMDRYVEICKKAYELYPTNVYVLHNLAIAYHIEGYYEKSNDIYDKIIAANYGKYVHRHAWSNKAMNFEKLGMYNAAILCNRKVLEIDNEDITALASLSDYFTKEKQYDSAFIYLDKAIAIDSTWHYVYLAKGDTYKAMGKEYYPQAIAEYEKAIRFCENDDNIKEIKDSIAIVKKRMRK